MKVKEVIAMLEQYDGERELVFADYTQVVIPTEKGDQAKEQYIILRDDPIAQVVDDEDSNTLRLCSEKGKLLFEQELNHLQ